jgi:hypothetical protein
MARPEDAFAVTAELKDAPSKLQLIIGLVD